MHMPPTRRTKTPPPRSAPRWRPARRPVVRGTLTAAGIALCAPLTIEAAQTAQDSLAVIGLPGVRVEVPRPTATIGGSSAVEVSVDSARVIAAPTMEDFLRGMPFIQIRANSRGEAQPAMRGAEDRQIAVLLDGIPLTLGWDHRTDLSIVPLTAVRQLTLLRGLSSVLHGPNVLGGALEFDVARGASWQAPPPSASGAISIAQGGETNLAGTAAAVIVDDYVTWWVRGGGAYRERSGVTLPSGAHRHEPSLRPELLKGADGLRLNSDRRQVDGFVSSRFTVPTGTWFSGLLSLADTHRGVPPEAHVSDPRLWRYPEQNRLFATFSGGSGERSTRWGRGDFEASFGLDRSAAEITEYATHGYRFQLDGETGQTTTLTTRLLGDHVFPQSGELRTALTIASVSHEEDFHLGDRFRYRQRLWSLGTEFEVAGDRLWGNEGDDGEAPAGVSETDSGTRLTIGASIDGASTPRSGDKTPLGTMWDWGLRAGVTHSARGGTALFHAGISRRTRFPSLRELYSGALGRFEPNPGLHPESLIAGETGVTFDRREGQIQIVGFYHVLFDGIVRTRVVTPTGTRFQRINRDEIHSAGVEMLVAGTRGRFTYGGDLTLQRVRVRDSGPLGSHEAEYEPGAAGNARLSVAGPSDVLFSGSVRYRGDQFCESVDAPGLAQLNASATLDLEVHREFGLGARATRRLDGTLGMANLTDSVVLDQCGLPQPGRTFRIQLNLR